MLITHDYSYTNKNLIKNGYAVYGIHSLNFDRYFTEEEMTQNRQFAEQYGAMSQEWIERCEQSGREICKQMKTMMEVLNKKYAICQYNPQVKYGEHDLYFYSNRGWNGNEWYDYIQLCFNDKLDTDRNNQILNELLELATDMELKNVLCCVQYDTIVDNEKLYIDAIKIYKDLKGKFINFKGHVGKIKEISEYDGKKQYGFFRKGAKKYYKALSYEEIVFNCTI